VEVPNIIKRFLIEWQFLKVMENGSGKKKKPTA
jgi:hypothetical protein